MIKETEEFYLKHKDKSWTLPKFPNNIDETDADAVVKWILEEMKAGNFGWIELNLMNVKGGQFIPIAWHHMGQIETQVIEHRNFYTQYKKPSHVNAYGCTLFGKDDDRTNLSEDPDEKGDWVKEVDAETPNITAWWEDDFPIANYKKIRFVKLEANGSVAPHNDNINKDKDKILNPIRDIFPILLSMKEPGGRKCHTVVEDFGTVPIKEGKIYLINPYRKHVMVNTSETDSCVHMNIQGIPGQRYGEFINCITRTYFELEGRLGKDYLRGLPIKPKGNTITGPMDY